MTTAQPGVQFAHTRDGVTIAYSASGQGAPVILTPDLASNLEVDTVHETPSMTRFFDFHDGLSAGGRRRVVIYDGRGTGLSDRHVDDCAAAVRALDIEAVVDALGAPQVTLLGTGFGGPPALVYAATHPERVTRLVLYGTFASPLAGHNPALARALIDLIRADWTIGARTLMDFVHAGAERALIDFLAGYMAASCTGTTAAAIMEEAMFRIDLRDLLPGIAVPALVVHRRDDSAVPVAKGRELATLLAHARLVTVQGSEHLPFLGDVEAVLAPIAAFLEDDAPGVSEPADVPPGSLTILF